MKCLAIGIQVDGGSLFSASEVMDVSSPNDEDEIANCLQEKTGVQFDQILVVKNDQVVNDFQPRD